MIGDFGGFNLLQDISKAVEIYAKAFKSDPSFYEFTRTLETYQKMIDTNTTLILSTDSDLLNLIKGKK